MISTFNIIATFVSTTILIQEQEARRVQTIAKWIRVSSHLRTWGSLNSIITVFSGLKHSSIYRLKADFAKLKPSDATTFEEISNLCSSARGYVEARKFIKSANPPCIPYLGMLLTDVRTLRKARKISRVTKLFRLIFISWLLFAKEMGVYIKESSIFGAKNS